MQLAEKAVADKVLPSLIGDERLKVMAALAESAPAGVFVEVGVYRGGSLNVLYNVAQAQKRELFAFDSFEGMPVAGVLDSHKIGDFADCDPMEIMRALPSARLVKGVFPHSLKFNLPPIAFVHADGDQYETTRSIIEVLGPLMVKGGMILFDDYVGLQGCISAVEQFAPQREVLPDGRALVTYS